VDGSDLTQRGPGHIRGNVEVLGCIRGFGLCLLGSGTFPWGSGSIDDIVVYATFSSYVAAPESSMWWGRALFTVPSYRNKGYPCSRVLIVAPGPASGEVTSLQVGPKPGWRLACHFRALADVATANPPSGMPPATSVPAADRYMAPTPGSFVGPRAQGVSLPPPKLKIFLGGP
jgi:hypothetical protein